MIEDNPEWQAFTNMLTALYQHHPVRVSVAGSQESISHITADTLYHCHRAFYCPGNMVLCVAGDVDPDRIAALAEEILPKEAGARVARDYGEPEPKCAATPLVSLSMEVSTPIFQLGFKAEPVEAGEARLRQELICELVCDALFGTSSPLYARLYGEGLVNHTFRYGYEAYPGCAMIATGGESRDPEAVRDAILAEGLRIGQDGIDEGLWNRLRKALYGNRVRDLNSFDHTCIQMAQAHFAGCDYLRFPQVFDGIEKKDAEEAIRRFVTASRAGMAVITPKEGN